MIDMIELVIGIVFVCLALIPICLTLLLLIYASQAATSWVGQCRRCGYDLRGLSHGTQRACPECGQPFAVSPQGDAIS